MKVNNAGTLEMSKDETRALNAYRRCEKSPAWSRVSAYVIISPDGKGWGKIKAAWPSDGMGPLHVFAWDCSGDNGIQYGKASGCGYDKLSAALVGIKWGDIVFTDHPVNWEIQLRKAGYTVVQAV